MGEWVVETSLSLLVPCALGLERGPGTQPCKIPTLSVGTLGEGICLGPG